jgi:sulfatase maturation enzyme AslB (radical SAM superfamily)
MELNSFTLIVTDDCNYDCIYCPQTKENLYIDESITEKSLDFFYPFFTEEISVNFYGGEPLLVFDQVQHAIGYLEGKNREQGKKIKYSMTTNGSLLDETIISFLDQHKFSLLLSFDGLAQDTGRKQETFDTMVEIIKEMPNHPDIEFGTNSVFTPESVDDLSTSIQFIIGLGISNSRLALSTVEEWDDKSLFKLKEQLTDLKEFLISFYRENSTIPVSEFRRSESTDTGIFGCFAAQDRMAVTPDGMVWGCYRFPDFFKDKKDTREFQKFFLGHLDDFIKNHETILRKQLPHYKNLFQENFYTDQTFCFACEEVGECKVCPVNAALSGSILLGKIPLWICKINKLKKEMKTEFHKEIAVIEKRGM